METVTGKKSLFVETEGKYKRILLVYLGTLVFKMVLLQRNHHQISKVNTHSDYHLKKTIYIKSKQLSFCKQKRWMVSCKDLYCWFSGSIIFTPFLVVVKIFMFLSSIVFEDREAITGKYFIVIYILLFNLFLRINTL